MIRESEINQIVGAGFSWDGDGNPTTYFGNSLTVDGENHLTSLDNSGFNYIRANYRDDGLRNSKRSINSSDGNALPTYYIYDGDQVLYGLYDTLDGGFMPRRCFGVGAAGVEQEFEDARYMGGDPSLDSSYDFPQNNSDTPLDPARPYTLTRRFDRAWLTFKRRVVAQFFTAFDTMEFTVPSSTGVSIPKAILRAIFFYDKKLHRSSPSNHATGPTGFLNRWLFRMHPFID